MTESLGQDYNNLLKQNNEIIIDGVNVKSCINYGKNQFNEDVCYMEGFNLASLCRLKPNCYFKQLQRVTTERDNAIESCVKLEGEVEELQRKLEDAVLNDEMMLINQMNDEIVQLKAKNEELEIQNLEICVENTLKKARIEFLEQALSEIKEITEKVDKNYLNYDFEDLQLFFTEISDKIQEVINE